MSASHEQHPTGGFRRGDARVNGFRMAYLEDGPQDGPLAICLHGFPDHALTWRDLIPRLADAGYRAVAPWMRGYHPTEIPPRGHYQHGALASDVVQLHEVLGGDDRAVVIGHDWGAVAAYGAAAGAPERWRRVVALAVPPPAVWVPEVFVDLDQLRRSRYIAFFQLPFLPERVISRDDLSGLDRIWYASWDGYRDAPDFREALHRTFEAPGTLSAALGYYRAIFNPLRHSRRFLHLDLAGLRVPPQPTLFLAGDDDRAISPRWAREAAPLLAPGSEADVVEGGHWFHLERPDAIAERILGFIA